jgi:hypothetical protein
MFMIPIAPTKSDSPVTKSPASAMPCLDRVELLLEQPAPVDREIVPLARNLAPHPAHVPVSSSRASSRRVLSFTFTWMLRVVVTDAEVLPVGAEGNEHLVVEAEQPEERPLLREDADDLERLALTITVGRWPNGPGKSACATSSPGRTPGAAVARSR